MLLQEHRHPAPCSSKCAASACQPRDISVLDARSVTVFAARQLADAEGRRLRRHSTRERRRAHHILRRSLRLITEWKSLPGFGDVGSVCENLDSCGTWPLADRLKHQAVEYEVIDSGSCATASFVRSRSLHGRNTPASGRLQQYERRVGGRVDRRRSQYVGI